MTENKYLGNEALPEVIYAINNRLKTVVTMPATADDGQVLLYVGTASVNYETGHVYKYSSTDGWVDITSAVSIQVSTVAELEAIETGTIVQYVGATTSSYTKGYFYTKSNLSTTLNVTAGSGYYMTNIGTSELESILPYSLYGGWSLNSVSDVDTAVAIISDTGAEATCDNTDITVSVGTSGAGTISLSYGATGTAPSDPFTVTMTATVISAVSTMAIEVDAPEASEVSYDDTSGELDADNVQDAIDALNDKVDALPTVDQTYDATSTNAQSGTAVAGAATTAINETQSSFYPHAVASLADLQTALTNRADGLAGYNSYIPVYFYCSSDITMSNDEVLSTGTIITLTGNTSSGSGVPYGTAVSSTGDCYTITCSDTIGTTINAYPLVNASRGAPAQIVLEAGEIGQLTAFLSGTAAQYQAATILINVPGTSGGFALYTLYTSSSQILLKQCCMLTSPSLVPYYLSNSAISGTDKHFCIANNTTASITISLLSCTTDFSSFGTWSTVSSLPSDVSSSASAPLSITTGVHGTAYVNTTLSSSTTYSYILSTAFLNKQFYLCITRQGPGTVLLTPRILEFSAAASCIWREIGSSTWNTAVSSFTLSDGSVLTFSTVSQGTTYGVITLSNPSSGYTYAVSLFATFDSSLTLTAL